MRSIFVAVSSAMAAFLGSTGLALAQSTIILSSAPMAGGQGQKAPNPSQLSIYVSSDIAVSSSGAPDDHRSRGRPRHQLTAYHGTGQESAERAPGIPRLCFHPGIGWTAIPAAPFIANNDPEAKPSGTDMSGANPPLQIRRGLPSSASSPSTGECPPMPISQTAIAGTDCDESGKHCELEIWNPLMTPAPWLNQQGKGMTDIGDPEAALEELKALRHRAYIGPVKLRRLSRSVQDLQTRLELRQMKAEVEKRKSRRATENQNTGTETENATGHKSLHSVDLLAKRADCARTDDVSKSRRCPQPKHY